MVHASEILGDCNLPMFARAEALEKQRTLAQADDSSSGDEDADDYDDEQSGLEEVDVDTGLSPAPLKAGSV